MCLYSSEHFVFSINSLLPTIEFQIKSFLALEVIHQIQRTGGVRGQMGLWFLCFISSLSLPRKTLQTTVLLILQSRSQFLHHDVSDE